ncbi:reverse transcriptase, partial [Tanacetum coccineum]
CFGDVCKVERPSQWCPPDDGALKFNVDGSAKGKPGFAAIGGLLRNSEGAVVALFSIPVGVMDSNVAEVLAIKEACKMLNKKVEFNSVKIVIESDSLNAGSWECNSDADKLAKDGVYRTSPLSIWKDGRVTL